MKKMRLNQQFLRRLTSCRVSSGRVGSLIDFLQTLYCKHASRASTETQTETARKARMQKQGIAVAEGVTHPREALTAPRATSRKRT